MFNQELQLTIKMEKVIKQNRSGTFVSDQMCIRDSNALDCVAEGCGIMLENTQYLK